MSRARVATSGKSLKYGKFAFAVLIAIAFCVDRKSTRLNSSHLVISYAVFCLKKKTHRLEPLLGDGVALGCPVELAVRDPVLRLLFQVAFLHDECHAVYTGLLSQRAQRRGCCH